MTADRLDPRFLPAGWRRDLDTFLAERAAGMNAFMLSRRRVERQEKRRKKSKK